MSDYRDLMAWINSMMSLVTSEELGNDVTGSEALIERHQVWKIVNFFRSTREFSHSTESITLKLKNKHKNKIQNFHFPFPVLVKFHDTGDICFTQNHRAEIDFRYGLPQVF